MIAMAMPCPDDGIPHPFSLNWHSFCFFFHDAPLVLEGLLQMSYLRLRIQHTQCLWVSAFTAIHCKEKLLQSRLRAASIYGYKHRDWEGKLVLCQCNSTAVISSPIRPRTSTAMCFGLGYSTRLRFPPVERASNLVKGWLTVPIAAEALLHKETHLARMADIEDCRAHTWLRSSGSFLQQTFSVLNEACFIVC